MKIDWYWRRFRRGLPVTYHLSAPEVATWTGVYGCLIGSWFIGVIRGTVGVPARGRGHDETKDDQTRVDGSK